LLFSSGHERCVRVLRKRSLYKNKLNFDLYKR
jgi:hypothetical protein